MARPKKEESNEGVYVFGEILRLNRDEKKQFSFVVENERDDVSFNEKRNTFDIVKKKTDTLVPVDFFKGCDVNELGYCADVDVYITGVVKDGIRAELEF